MSVLLSNTHDKVSTIGLRRPISLHNVCYAAAAVAVIHYSFQNRRQKTTNTTNEGLVSCLLFVQLVHGMQYPAPSQQQIRYVATYMALSLLLLSAPSQQEAASGEGEATLEFE